MSFALPPVKSKPGQPERFAIKEGAFGVPDLMTHGLSSARADVDSLHPLMQSERNHRTKLNNMNMSMLRNTQGMHAPLRIAMEVKAAKKVGRLPFLSSSNVMLDSLTGRDIEIDPTDVFNIPENIEVMGQPHAMVERSLGLL